MRDFRNDFMVTIQDNLSGILDPELLDQVSSVISLALDKYELSERVTDLVPQAQLNEDLMKTYASCLAIDGKSKGTVAAYIRELRKLSEFIGGRSFLDVNTFDIRNYLATAKLRGLAGTSVENIRARVMSFYTWLTKEEYITANPCARISPIKCNIEKETPFSSVEMDALRCACTSKRDRALLEFLVSSGVRVSELADIMVEDIDFRDMKVRVRHGKGDKARTTYVNEVARKYILEYMEENQIMSGILFTRNRKKNGQKIGLSDDGVRHVLRQIGNRAGVGNVHPHRFRKTFATSLATRGMSIQEIQQLLGHANINTTMIYVSVSDEQIETSYKKHSA